MTPTRFVRRLVVVSLVALGAGAGAQVRDSKTGAPPPSPGTGVIAGTVVSADMGRPVRRARVTISGGTPSVSRSVTTNDQGGFEFLNLSAGEFTLTASKGGYVQSIFGQKHPGSGRLGTPIQLAAAQRVINVSLPLARGSVITGGVFDETGEPFYGASVRAYRWVMQAGERSLQQAGQATTDDRGLYRIPLLLPGDYVVSASAATGAMVGELIEKGAVYVQVLDEISRAEGVINLKIRDATAEAAASAPAPAFPTMFYPGVLQASGASSVPLAPGEERSGVNFHMPLMPTSRVWGVVLGPDGPAAGATVYLLDPAQVPGLGMRQTRTTTDGRFGFPGVTPGQYSLVARALPRGSRPLEASGREAAEFLASVEEAKRAQVAAAMGNAASLWASADVTADGRGEVETQLTLQPGLTMSGRVVLEGVTGVAPPLTRMSVSLVPIGVSKSFADANQPPPAPVDATGRFTVRGVMPGRYSIAIAAGAPAGFTLQSAVFGAADILDAPFVLTGHEQIPPGTLTLSTKTTEVSGLVRDQTGQPTAAVTVIAFSVDERFWTPRSRRIQAIRPSTDGRYVIRNLPPGVYRLIAIEDVEPGRWHDPAFLRNLRDASSVTVGDGGKNVVDLSCKLSERYFP